MSTEIGFRFPVFKVYIKIRLFCHFRCCKFPYYIYNCVRYIRMIKKNTNILLWYACFYTFIEKSKKLYVDFGFSLYFFWRSHFLRLCFFAILHVKNGPRPTYHCNKYAVSCHFSFTKGEKWKWKRNTGGNANECDMKCYDRLKANDDSISKLRIWYAFLLLPLNFQFNIDCSRK